MNHTENKLDWCLKKAEKELKTSNKHRGLVRIEPNINKSRDHIKKAEHNLELMMYLKNTKYSDWCSSTAFYAIYHCLLAIALKFGYESRNQECTFALIFNLIETNKINLDKKLVEKISTMGVEITETTTIGIREHYQYGTELTLKEETYKDLLDTARKILGKTKEIIEG